MKRELIVTFLFFVAPSFLFAQKYKFKELNYTPIKGAPILSKPKFLKSSDGDLISVRKIGHAGVALYDWNKDGVKDLLVGEFAYKDQANVMVFENKGTNKKPIYSYKPYYAEDAKKLTLYSSTS